MSVPGARSGIVPAHLSTLAIYNPSLSSANGDDAHQQILYYYHKKERENASTSRKSTSKESRLAQPEVSKDELNERLRQVGLAQGMVQFAREFSNGKSIDSIDTEKARVVLLNLESDWWLLASVTLTQIPSQAEATSKTDFKAHDASVEFSAREVSPPALLIQQILRAHRIFLLHQSSSLSALWKRCHRSKFCSFLKRFWDAFIWTWNVLLHGNPAADIYNGLKLSGGGELGYGEDEQQWGGGEREVLAGFVGRTEGLVDLVVSRFGDVNSDGKYGSPSSGFERSFATGEYPTPADGVIFSGIGALARSSVRDISGWVEWLSMYGESAYGIRENPSSTTTRRKKKARPIVDEDNETSAKPFGGPDIPPPITSTSRALNSNKSAQKMQNPSLQPQLDTESGSLGTETFMKYLTLGVYGSTWGLPAGRPAADNKPPSSLRHSTTSRSAAEEGEKPEKTAPTPGFSVENHGDKEPGATKGYFLIGLLGDLEEEDVTQTDQDSNQEDVRGGGGGSRIIMRSLHVERIRRPATKNDHSQSMKMENGEARDATDDTRDPLEGKGADGSTHLDRLRVVIYIQPPFIFTLLFENDTPSLSLPVFYRSLYHQLGPLQRPLEAQTSPHRVHERMDAVVAAGSPSRKSSSANTIPSKSTGTGSINNNTNSQPINDLVFDPVRLTIHTSIPNIPDPSSLSSVSTPGQSGPATSKTPPAPWTRAEGITVHSQILNTYISTRPQPLPPPRRGLARCADVERTCKTSRGWWVVWLRLPTPRPPRTPPQKPATTSSSAGADAATNTDVDTDTQTNNSNENENEPGDGDEDPGDREAILIRKASDYVGPNFSSSASGHRGFPSASSSSSTMALMGMGRFRGGNNNNNGGGSSVAGWGAGAGKLAEGIGVDARLYVESLLRLSR